MEFDFATNAEINASLISNKQEKNKQNLVLRTTKNFYQNSWGSDLREEIESQ